ncbi:MAG: 1,4-dihydroxy-2-naphthoate octaprenyltransferase [Verrucomicrobiota bacterium]
MLNTILLAARPKTLPAAIVPVWSGCVLAWKLNGQFSLLLALCTLGSAIAIQIATNFFNDAIDSDKGADTEARLGPTRATASGLLPRKTVYTLATLFLILATLLALPLIQARGWLIIAIGLPSLFLAYGYTGGPFPLAYLGLGELFVILFFGLIAVTGTAFVQTGQYHPEALLLGLTVGSLSAILITINNLRDIEEDTQASKKTLAVRWGWPKARWLPLIETLVAFTPLFLLKNKIASDRFVLLVLPLALLYSLLANKIRRHKPSPTYNKSLAQAGLLLIAFAIVWHLLLTL